MMINEESKKDLTAYTKVTIWSAVILVFILMLALGVAYITKNTVWIHSLFGALFGTILATINLFAIGQAFFVLAIKKGRRLIVLWPVFTFLAMCLTAFILAFYYPSFILGFALGLTTPVVFGATVILAVSKPA